MADLPLPGFAATASPDDRVRLLRVTLRVRKLRRRYLRGMQQLRAVAWAIVQDARACSTTGGNKASGSTSKKTANRFASS
jgi:hypothetical protein